MKWRERSKEDERLIGTAYGLSEALKVFFDAGYQCRQGAKCKEVDFGVVTCCRPALWKVRIDAGNSVFSCDQCLWLREYHKCNADEFHEAPHAAAIRAFDAWLAKLGRPPGLDDAEGREEVRDLYLRDRDRLFQWGRDVLLALPPCPPMDLGVLPTDDAGSVAIKLATALNFACVRCGWHNSHAMIMSLYQLTKLMAKEDPQRFGDWPTSPTAQYTQILDKA